MLHYNIRCERAILACSHGALPKLASGAVADNVVVKKTDLLNQAALANKVPALIDALAGGKALAAKG